MTTAICPACGYPTVGPDLCAFCRPEVALTVDRTIEPMLSATRLLRESAREGMWHFNSHSAAHAS